MKLRVDCPGFGNKNNPKILFIGERPGAKEFELKKPFVGRAGKFLDKELEKIGIKRDENYITNIVKSYAEGNKAPTKEEIQRYLPLLEKEIEEINPKIIVLLGKTASENVPRNSKYTYLHIIHPSAAMRFNKPRIKFLEGMQKLKTFVTKN